jgi:DNA-binding transcriptional MerR regulator
MLTIGNLAAETALTTNTLRFYEREGLLRPSSKSPAGYRLYDASAVARVRFIKQAQHCGFTLTEINELLTLRSQRSACCDDVRRIAIEKKLQLEAKVRAMKVMAKALDVLIAECPDSGHPLEDCPILSAMEQAGAQSKT